MDDQEQADGSQEWSPGSVLSRTDERLSWNVYRDEGGQMQTQPGTEAMDRCVDRTRIQMCGCAWMERSEGGAGTIFKRYTVISAQTPRGPEYRIYDRVNECSIEGGFDTQRWAEAVAEMMEEKWKNEQGTVKRRE